MIGVKKKVKTRYGKVEMSKSHRFIESIKQESTSPYFRELLLFMGQEDNYAGAARYIEKLLRISTNPMQIYRTVSQSADKVNTLLSQETAKVEISDNENIYAMLDGGMLLTRPSEWKEAKLGRVFKEESIHKMCESRNEIRDSEYIAHLGNHKDFERKMGVLTDKYASLGSRLIFINDGARWIWNWVDAEYPKAKQILDYYHAKEHLGTFASFYFTDKETRGKWIEKMGCLLKESGPRSVINQVNKLEKKTRTVEVEKEKLLNYYKNNLHRMNYPLYIREGLLIGSGAIEAAHRTISQKRLKQSGQRWSITGAQNILNLRCMNKSNRWNEIQDWLKTA